MISIIVCTYNRAKYLYDALASIASNDFPCNEYEIILVNNNSTDDTEEKCQQFVANFPDVNLRYCTESKQGLSFARNKGIAESRGDFLVFLDDDVVVKSDYLRNLKTNLDNTPDLMAFGGKITPRFEAGHPPKWLNCWMYSLISATNCPDKTRKYGKRKYPIGANMGFRRQCLEKSGYFNTELGRTGNILLGGEEKDIFLKIKGLGMEIYYFPDVEIEHIIPESRTTEEYIERVGLGVGISEQIRCTSAGKRSLHKRYFQEFVKWCGTIVLATYYTITFRSYTAKIMLKFRKNVSKGLRTATNQAACTDAQVMQ
jgi:glycosyltransferase involved in cell wall biosynthesis